MSTNLPRRPMPSQTLRIVRMRQLQNEVADATLVSAGDSRTIGLEPGNTKTGTSGGRFGQILVWNIPPLLTCPGASAWCQSACYAGDVRPEVFNRPRWRRNLAAYHQRPNVLLNRISAQLKLAKPDVGVRIHTSGDFFDADYILFWQSLIEENPTVTFWAYTRSWVLSPLKVALETLRLRPNIQLFASWDPTMPQPPHGWRLSIVRDSSTYDLQSLPQARTVAQCPEEFDRSVTCATCGFCLESRPRGVLFNVH